MTTVPTPTIHEHQLDWVEQFHSAPSRVIFSFNNGEKMEFSQNAINALIKHDTCLASLQEDK